MWEAMRVYFPFLDYAWLKLWVLPMVAVQAAEVVSFSDRMITPKHKTFGERAYEHQCKNHPRRCLK